ncbi:MAG: carboxypeptidase regulatory-like domain-containing protein [Planctomycetes bacterium]|nr:carboxypeptidase regulatory-like domain-containing protein [Planctomycetota bacterium]
MKPRSSKLLPALLLLLVAGLGAVAWMSLRESSSSAADLGPGEELALGDTPTATSLAAPEDALGETAAQGAAAQSTPETESERRQQATLAEAELKQGLWIEGRVVFPADTPRGEVVEVVALGRKFKNREMHRVKVEPDGSFKVAFAPGTTTGRLDVDALHLFLDKPLTVRMSTLKEPPVLEPFLGGALRGRLKLGPGTESLAKELVGKTVRASGWSSRWRDMFARAGKVDRDLSFELRGLPPELGLNIEFDSNVVTRLSVTDFRAPAGETVERDFDLSAGVRVRGKVRSSEGALPKGVVLQARTKGLKDDPFGSGRESGKVGDDGGFDLRGLSPGEITLTVSAPQRVTQKLELGLLENGAVKEGVELVLDLGHQVSGRVLWPDGTPAVDAQVVATGGGGDDDPFNPFDGRFTVRTNAAGEFQISGLNAGPYGLLSQGKPRAEDGSKKRKGPTWKARLENVAADTHGMEVRLVAGYSVEGLVVDDLGAPVTAFGVVATAKDEGKRSFNLSRMVSGMYKPEDGRFELGGLLEGGYTIRLNVLGHDDPEPLDVMVPGDGTVYTFVAPRRASISGLVLKPDGSPAVRAEVEVEGSKGRWGDGGADKADNEGRFQIPSAETGKVKISAKLVGFAPSEPFEAEVVGGESITNLRLTLRQGGRITGEVLPSKQGERVDSRRVTAQQAGGGESYDTTTDRGGKFEFKNVAPGEYALAAEAAATEVDQLREPGARRGNDWDLVELTKKRGTVAVADGSSVHAVLGAPPATPVTISGRVHRGSQGVGGVRIVAQSDGSDGWNRRKAALTDDSGHYEVVTDGAGGYQIQVSPGGRGGTTIGRHIDVPEAGAANVDFELPSGRIAGKVVGPDGAELGWVQLQLARLPSSGEEVSQWTSGNTSTNQDGEFEFKNLPAGDFTLEVRGSSWNRRTFEQRQYGMVKLDIPLGEGEVKDDLRIEMEAAGSLRVTILLADGSPAGSGRMTVRRLDVGASTYTSMDDNGFSDGSTFREDLLPGSYEVTIQVDDQVSPQPERVTILSSETTEITIRLRPGGKVKFQAVDAQGAQVQALATLVDGSGRPFPAGRPLRNGEVSSSLPPGTCRVQARDNAGRSAEASCTVKAGELTEVTVTFP